MFILSYENACCKENLIPKSFSFVTNTMQKDKFEYGIPIVTGNRWECKRTRAAASSQDAAALDIFEIG